MHYFCCKNQKKVLQKEIKDWTFEVYLLTEETSFSFSLFESLKMTFARSYALFLNILSNREGLDWFLWHVLPKLCKITVTCPKWVIENGWGQFCCPKLAKWISTLNCPNSSQVKARNIKFRQQINIIESISLGTLLQEVVMSLAYNHVKISFFRVTEGLLLSNLGSKSISVKEVDTTLLQWG